MNKPIRFVWLLSLALVLTGSSESFAQSAPAGWDTHRHPVLREHPRLFGSRDELRVLAQQRAADYQRMKTRPISSSSAATALPPTSIWT